MKIRYGVMLLFYSSFLSGMLSPSPYCTRGLGHWLMGTIGDLIIDAVWLQSYVISVDTLKVIAGAVPLYIVTRLPENKVHSWFYDSKSHKNCKQLPHSCQRVINKLGDCGIIALSSLAFIAQDERLYTTARIFALGAVSGLLVKDIIKESKIDANIRPWCEQFSRKKRAYGGFPSGHMFEAAYMATVWGLQYGLRAGIPLAAFGAVSFFSLINCNRHYASQLVAGAALGVIYGLAANTLINKKLNKDINVSCFFDKKGYHMSCAYQW